MQEISLEPEGTEPTKSKNQNTPLLSTKVSDNTSTDKKYCKIIAVIVTCVIVVSAVIATIITLTKSDKSENDNNQPQQICSNQFLFVYDTSTESRIYTMNDINIDKPYSSQIISSFCVNKSSELILHTNNDIDIGRQTCNNYAENINQTLCQLDITGKTILPGLIDTHAHIMSQGSLKFKANLMGAESIEQIVNIINVYIEEYPDRIESMDYWIEGRGWDQNIWKNWPDNTMPTRFDLDKYFNNNKYKIYLTRIDGHSAWFNTNAFNAVPDFSNVSNDDIEGGEIIFYDGTDNVTGILIDTAMNYIRDYIPQPSLDEQQLMLESVIQECSMNGLTGIHDAGSSPDIHNLFKSYVNTNLSQFNIRILSMASSAYSPQNYTPIFFNQTHNRLETNSVKFMLDGALGSGGAQLIEPYCDSNTSGIGMYNNLTEFELQLLNWLDYGYQLCTHAIGDQANRNVINTYENIIIGRQLNNNHRFRIEHAQVVNMNDIQRIGQLNILPIMQPTHATSDMVFVPTKLLCNNTENTKTRINGSYAWNSMLNANINALGFGSDFPAVGVVNPFLGLYAAITRKDENGNPQGGWMPWERVSKYQAVKGYTYDAGYVGFKENLLGSLVEGKLADFIVIDTDFFELNEDEYQKILNINVLETYLGGTNVYKR